MTTLPIWFKVVFWGLLAFWGVLLGLVARYEWRQR